MRSTRQAGIGFILITVLVDVIGWGLMIPVMPELIGGLKHISTNEASQYGGYLLSVYSGMQFICAPILGNLSDKYGRSPVLLFSLFGFGVEFIFFGLAPTY
jgi:DHA1 family tetracycline resistance protein-like MFS transporter